MNYINKQQRDIEYGDIPTHSLEEKAEKEYPKEFLAFIKGHLSGKQEVIQDIIEWVNKNYYTKVGENKPLIYQADLLTFINLLKKQ